ncbi:MAG: hypothetical protein P1U41_05815 [Vicingaceae bacterium]|nr:hypothetical protein [Vicingaceae bacterium]
MKSFHLILLCFIFVFIGCKKFSCECIERKPGEDPVYTVTQVTGHLSKGHSGFDEDAEKECENLEIKGYPHNKLCNLK